ncbi:MAG: aspartate carbamoyltransferase regulatory subunit [Ignisphaera sp.]|uniref:Aspartate carbamoyltransferase regulatory chain n=2 Tax=Ignisphaera aggregans TaxID=334771 RepID=A0A7J3MY82_9CREN
MSSENIHTLVVPKILNGTVIDHIPAGRALDILKVLNITGGEGWRIAVLLNVESKKLGRKDIIKIERRKLTSAEVNVIALIAPTATINIIENFVVVEKFKVNVPEIIEGVIRCPNPTCISNKEREPVKSRFRTLSKDQLVFRCEYCSTIVTRDDILKLIIR